VNGTNPAQKEHPKPLDILTVRAYTCFIVTHTNEREHTMTVCGHKHKPGDICRYDGAVYEIYMDKKGELFSRKSIFQNRDIPDEVYKGLAKRRGK
jgi:hypothetical protein